MDNLTVGRMAAEHLLKLGPRTFAYQDVGDSRLSQLRFEGFRARAAAVAALSLDLSIPGDLAILRTPDLERF
ncbi:MAG: hypothetical protein LAT83_08025 [Kiritimatiellae bacterium]|nr:hypothetical protein [Kiritimatiellia bacterium]